LPVLDLHEMVEGAGSGSRHRTTVIIGRGRRRDRPIFGLAVDEVLRMVNLASGSIEHGESEIATDSTIEGEAVKILNTGTLLSETRDDTGALDG
jgi:chemotaxis signal transduction protein